MKRRVLSVEAKASTLMAIFDFLDKQGKEPRSMAGAISTFLAFHVNLYQTAGQLPVYDSEEDCEILLADRVELSGRVKRARQLNVPITTQMAPASATRGKETLREHIHREAITDADFAPLTYGPSVGKTPYPSFNSGFEQKLTEPAGGGIRFDLANAPAETISMNTLDDLLHKEIEEQERMAEEDLLSKIMLGPVAKSSDLPKVKKQMQMISAGDPRLVPDRLWKTFCAEGDELKQTALRIVYFHLAEEYWSTEKAEELLVSILQNLQTGG